MYKNTQISFLAGTTEVAVLAQCVLTRLGAETRRLFSWDQVFKKTCWGLDSQIRNNFPDAICLLRFTLFFIHMMKYFSFVLIWFDSPHSLVPSNQTPHFTLILHYSVWLSDSGEPVTMFCSSSLLKLLMRSNLRG